MDFSKEDIVWNLMELKLTPVVPLDCFASSESCKKEQGGKDHTDSSTANSENSGSAGGVIPSVLLQDTPMLSASFEDPSMCIDCEKGVCDSCPLHHRWKRMRNNNCYFDPNGLSQVKVPGWAAVATSKIPGAGLGLFAQQKVKYGVHLGHYKGVHRDPSTVSKNEDMSYAWEVKCNGKVVSIIDGSDPKYSNHLRYINCACYESEQNLVAYQFKGKIFYRTVRDIEKGEELLVWYGKEYAKNLGIVDSSMSLGRAMKKKSKVEEIQIPRNSSLEESVQSKISSLKKSVTEKNSTTNESVEPIISSKRSLSIGRRQGNSKLLLPKVTPASSLTMQSNPKYGTNNQIRQMFHARVRHSTIHMNIVPHSTGPVCSYMVNLEDGYVSVAEKSTSSWLHRSTAQSVKKSIKYRCPLCSELLNSKGKVYYHIKKYHRCSLVSRDSPYYCKKCNDWHKSAYTLWNHLRTLRRGPVQRTSTQGGYQNCCKNREVVIPSSEGTEIIDVETRTLRRVAVQRMPIHSELEENSYKSRQMVIPSSEGTEIIDVETL